MEDWSASVVCPGHYKPRQFEFHPKKDVILFGTLKGEVAIVNKYKDVVGHINSGLSRDRHDPILGLCWLRRNPLQFLVGSSHGRLRICSFGEDVLDGLTGTTPQEGKVLSSFEPFDKLTSVHVNSLDEYVLTSGYSFDVAIYDLQTNRVVRKFKDIHENHINISRFANRSPFLFATSSVDRTAKMWDLRVHTSHRPIYTCHSSQGHVMLCFSPDDNFLLTSAVDNEVTQYLTLDGRLHVRLQVAGTRANPSENFTRSYYSASGKYILSGSSEEQVVRLHCSSTGYLQNSVEMYPGRKHDSIFIQSLRGNPLDDESFCVLVNYRDTAYPLEIVRIEKTETSSTQLETHAARVSDSIPIEKSSIDSCYSLAESLSKLFFDSSEEFCNCLIVASDGSEYPCHTSILASRSPTLKSLIVQQLPVEHFHKPEQVRIGRGWDDELELDMLDTDNLNSANDKAMTNNVKLPRLIVNISSLVHWSVVESSLYYMYADGIDIDNNEGIDIVVALAVKNLTVDHFHTHFSSSNFIENLLPDLKVQLIAIDFLLQSATVLELPRLTALLEMRGRSLIENSTVCVLSKIAEIRDATQLLECCARYLVMNLGPVLMLCGPDSLPNRMYYDVLSRRKARLKLIPPKKENKNNSFFSVNSSYVRSLSANDMNNNTSIASSMETDDHYESDMDDIYDEYGVALNRLIPTTTGHTATPVGGPLGSMMLLGGGNRSQFHSCRQAMVYDTDEKVWTTQSIKGEAPSTLIFHTATPIDLNSEGIAQYILVCGGSVQQNFGENENSQSTLLQTWILDTLAMKWFKYEQHAMSSNDTCIPESRTRHTTVSFPKEEFKNSTNLVLFGGFSPTIRTAFNDVYVVTASKLERSEFPYSLSWTMPQIEGTEPSPRLAHTAVAINGLGPDQGAKMIVFGGVDLMALHNDTHVLDCSNFGRILRWEETNISGQPPCVRYGHSMVTLSSQLQCVLFGGTNGQDDFNDIYILYIEHGCSEQGPEDRNARPIQLVWLEALLNGPSPCPRSRHSMCLIHCKEESSLINIYVFGGSIEAPNAGDDENPSYSNTDVDRNVYILKLLIQSPDDRGDVMDENSLNRDSMVSEYSEFGRNSLSTSASESSSDLSVTFCWSVSEMHLYSPIPELPLIIPPPSLSSDLGSILKSNFLSDTEIKLPCNSSDATTTPTNTAHYALIHRIGPNSCRSAMSISSNRNVEKCVHFQSPHNIEGYNSPTVLNQNKRLARVPRFFNSSDHAESKSPTCQRKFLSPTTSKSSVYSPCTSPGSYIGVNSLFAHKCLLSCRSNPLRAMLRNGMRESTTETITVKDMSMKTFQAMLQYMYTDNFTPDSVESVLELLLAANEYGLESLCAACEGFLRRNMDIYDAPGLYQYADTLHLPTMKCTALMAIIRDWSKMHRISGFALLPENLRTEIDSFRLNSSHIFSIDQSEYLTAGDSTIL